MVILFTVPVISLDQDSYEELENTTMDIIIHMSGDFTQPLTVYLTVAAVASANAALGKISSRHHGKINNAIMCLTMYCI